MNFPAELKYSKDHEWVKVNDNGTASVGITDYAQSELGDLVYVEVDTLGEEVDRGEGFGIVEAVKTTSDLYMPVSGKVLDFNTGLDDEPELINSDPYGKGWIVKIEISDASQLEDLMTAEAYQREIGSYSN